MSQIKGTKELTNQNLKMATSNLPHPYGTPCTTTTTTTSTTKPDLIEVKRRRFLSDYNIFGSRQKLPGHRTSLRVPGGADDPSPRNSSRSGPDPDITLDSDLILKLKSPDSSGFYAKNSAFIQSPDCSGFYSKNSGFSEYDITDEDIKRLKMLFRKGKETSSNATKNKSQFFEMCQNGAHSFMNSFIKCICDA